MGHIRGLCLSVFGKVSCPKPISLNFVRERAILDKTLFRGNERIRGGGAVGIYIHTYIAGLAVIVAAAIQLVLLICSYLSHGRSMVGSSLRWSLFIHSYC